MIYIPIIHALLLALLFYLILVKKVGGKPLMLIGAIVDITFNLTWATLIFWQWPDETFFTQRVSKNKILGGYRGKLATIICNQLNKYAPNHCK